MSPLQVGAVDVSSWADTFAALLAGGATYFDFLAATDLGSGETLITVHVMRPDASGRHLLTTEVPAGVALASLTRLYPAASWHEREATDLIGVMFTGQRDARPLVLADAGPQMTRPLRRDEPLAARLDIVWPGLTEPGVEPGTTKRRRPRTVPGNPQEWATEESSS